MFHSWYGFITLQPLRATVFVSPGEIHHRQSTLPAPAVQSRTGVSADLPPLHGRSPETGEHTRGSPLRDRH
jgi:hypothetical protein